MGNSITCPVCGSASLQLMGNDPTHLVHYICTACGKQSPKETSPATALSSWVSMVNFVATLQRAPNQQTAPKVDTAPANSLQKVITLDGHKILIDFIYPPIPNRNFDYAAYYADGGENAIIGWGRTEEAALRDLFDLADCKNEVEE